MPIISSWIWNGSLENTCGPIPPASSVKDYFRAHVANITSSFGTRGRPRFDCARPRSHQPDLWHPRSHQALLSNNRGFPKTCCSNCRPCKRWSPSGWHLDHPRCGPRGVEQPPRRTFPLGRSTRSSTELNADFPVRIQRHQQRTFHVSNSSGNPGFQFCLAQVAPNGARPLGSCTDATTDTWFDPDTETE
jgi:hypothetical protein